MQSTLLCLPLEILEIIASYAIGANGNLIHIKQTRTDCVTLHALGKVHSRQRIPGFGKNNLGPVPLPGLRHAICNARKTEDAAYAEAISNAGWVHTPQYEIERNATRHLYCGCCGAYDPTDVTELEKLHLALFASCRQLYHLGNTTLYAKNTFSFDDALSFGQFLAGLDPKQQKMIRSLHLSRPSVDTPNRASDRSAWMSALEPSSIRALEGLRTVHLCLEMNIHTHNSWYAQTSYKVMVLESILASFLQLRVLPLTKATVIISDDVTAFNSTTGGSSLHGRWTVAEKNEWAEKTRLKLLEPYVEGTEVSLDSREEAKKGMTMTKRFKKVFQRAGGSKLED